MATGPDHILRHIAFGLGGLAVLAAAFEFRDAVAPEQTPASVSESADDPLRATLRRCRALAVKEVATETVCREAWAENRRRFFAPGGSRSGREEE
ncbi:putative entry exclusion protein TrbK-alt [Woodsholea maritima]|uniref:putative entry exclusion protein TrbK-alt n=1 Tax=Woodsholea maritima TaxID=240237 RepID=UPI000374A937|nr:putative entry exclusion protein TrbK-alt [Woodsholea maritima]